MGLAFSLKSVIITVKSPTVTSRCWALLLSMFFNLGLVKRQTETRSKSCLEDAKYFSGDKAQRPVNITNSIPQLFMAFLFQRWFFITLVFLWFFFFLLFRVCGWCKLLIYLLCNQLRDRSWFSVREREREKKVIGPIVTFTLYQEEQGDYNTNLKSNKMLNLHNSLKLTKSQRIGIQFSQVCLKTVLRCLYCMYTEAGLACCNHSSWPWRDTSPMWF